MSKGQVEILRQILRAGSGTRRLPLEKVRANFDVFGARLSPPLPEARWEAVDAGGVRAEWVRAGEGPVAATLLYLHGGGFVIGSPASHRGLVTRLAAATGARILSVDYRRAPEDPFPAALEDAMAACRWLLARRDVAPERLGVVGDSAGGGLAVRALARLRDDGVPLPRALVTLSPWADYAGESASLLDNAALDPMVDKAGLDEMAALYLAGRAPDDPAASPLHADLHGLPPTLILAGEDETLRDDALRLAERLKAAGVDATVEVWPHMIHVWPLFAARLEEGQAAIERVAAWLGERW